MTRDKQLWVVNMASCDDDKHGDTLSGGERIGLESLKVWRGKFKKVIAICDKVWKKKSTEYLGKKIKLNYKWIDVPEKLYRNLLVLYFYKLVKSYSLVRKLEVRDGDYVFSMSDIFPDTLTAYWIKKIWSKKVKWVAALYFFASSPFSKEFPYRGLVPRLRGLLYWATQKLCYELIKRQADFVFSCNDLDKDRMMLDGIEEKKIFSVYGGVDLTIPQKVEQQQLKYDAVFMARFHPQKGPVEAIEAWKEVVKVKKEAKLAMIGKGSEEGRMRELIGKYRLSDNIEILGFLDGIEKYKVLKAAKIFLHTAIYDTGGMAVAEGMAAGLPAVAFDQPGYKYIYPTGIIKKAPIGNVKQIAKDVTILLENRKKYQQLKQEALSLVEDWNWDKRSLIMYQKMTK